MSDSWASEFPRLFDDSFLFRIRLQSDARPPTRSFPDERLLLNGPYRPRC